MASTPLLQNTTFGPDEIAVLDVAFEGALRQMNLIDRADPATEMVARKTIELAGHRERDAVRLRERVVKAIRPTVGCTRRVGRRGPQSLVQPHRRAHAG